MNKQKMPFFFLVPFLLIILAGCSNLVHRCINPEVNQCLMFASAQGGGRRRCGGIVD